MPTPWVTPNTWVLEAPWVPTLWVTPDTWVQGAAWEPTMLACPDTRLLEATLPLALKAAWEAFCPWTSLGMSLTLSVFSLKC